MKYYVVSEKFLENLLKDSNRLSALESGGVDSWEWYGESICDFLEEARCDTFDQTVQQDIQMFLDEKTINVIDLSK